MTEEEAVKLDREFGAVKKIAAALEVVDEVDRPRILGTVAILYGIDSLPTVEVIHHR